MKRRQTPKGWVLATVCSAAAALVTAPATAGPTPQPQPQEFTRFTNAQWGGRCSHPVVCGHSEQSDIAYSMMDAEVSLGEGSAQVGAESPTSARVTGTSYASMDAVYRLTAPVASLTVETMVSADAWSSAELRDQGDATAVFEASATHAACADCRASRRLIIEDDEENPVGVDRCAQDVKACVRRFFQVQCACEAPSGTIRVTFEITGPDGRVPAGDITIRALSETVASHLPGLFARAAITTQLERVKVTPRLLEAAS